MPCSEQKSQSQNLQFPKRHARAMIINRFEPTLKRIASAAFFLSLIVLSIIKIEDTDIWVHLSIGREIFNLHGIPSTQPFAYPSFGLEFRYASPLFGLLLYVTYLVCGFAGIVLLKAAIVFLAYSILYRDATSPCKNSLVAVLMLTGFVIMSRFRFVERPDILLMVLLAFTVYALNSYCRSGRRFIYALPVISAIWANTHSSIILIPVPFLAFIAGGITQNMLRKHRPHLPEWPTVGQIKIITVVFLLSFTATFINPHPFSQYTLGYGALTQKWAKQYIVELGPMTSWELGLLWACIGMTLLSFAVNWKRFSLVHFLLVLPFFLLPFSARRFLFLLGLIAVPVVTRNLSDFISDRPESIFARLFKNPLTTCLVILWITGYTVLGLAGKPPVGYDFKKFGLGVNELQVPSGVVRYMDENGVYGRTFNPFNWGGYIIWSGYPKRTVFIDPMGGLSENLLNNYTLATSGNLGSLWILEQLYGRYGFEAIILDYPSRENDASKLTGLVLSDPNWALVYWDDTSLLYLRRGGRHQALINRDEFRSIIPAAGRNGINGHLGDPETLAKIEAELKQSIQKTPSSIGFGLLAHLHSSTGRYSEAIAGFSKVLEYGRPVDLLSAYTGLGTVYYKTGDMNKALYYYERAVRIRTDGSFLYNLATIYIARGEDEKAVTALDKAILADPGLAKARQLLVETNRRLNRH
jgi:tetratricopeptide (TPR) repeat protein